MRVKIIALVMEVTTREEEIRFFKFFRANFSNEIFRTARTGFLLDLGLRPMDILHDRDVKLRKSHMTAKMLSYSELN